MIDLLSNIYLYILSSLISRWVPVTNSRIGMVDPSRNVGRSILSSILDSSVWLHDCIDYRADKSTNWRLRNTKIRFRKKDSRYLA